MESKTKNTKKSIEIYLRLGIVAVFTIFWITSGYDIIKNSGLFINFIENHTGNETTIFTWNSIIFGTFFMAVLCYPILFVMFLAFTLFDLKALKELMTKKTVLYFLTSPLLLTLLGAFYVFIGRAIVSGIVWIIFLAYPIYLILKWIYEKIRNE